MIGFRFIEKGVGLNFLFILFVFLFSMISMSGPVKAAELTQAEKYQQERTAEFDAWRRDIPDYERRVFERIKKVNNRSLRIYKLIIIGFVSFLLVNIVCIYFAVRGRRLKHRRVSSKPGSFKKKILYGILAFAGVALIAMFSIDYKYLVPIGSTGGSDIRAYRAYRAAAKSGDAHGQYQLAGSYYSGYGVDRDLDKAFYWFIKSAEQGLALAQRNLGVMYYSGVGTNADLNKAFFWYHKAAEQQDNFAQHEIGKMYAKGLGVKQDDKAAYMWFALSAAGGYKDTEKSLEAITENMSSAQVAEAEKLVNEWLVTH